MPDSAITILIPTYKRPGLLLEALRSAQNQTVSQDRYQILVVDNDPAPNAETERVVKAHMTENTRYVKNEENLGGYGNWNRGFQLAQTEWVCLLHDDDLLLSECVERALAILAWFETPRLGAVIPWQCNLFADAREEALEHQEKTKNWKARLDWGLYKKTAGRIWHVSLFDNYMICSAYPALSGGNLIRRSAVLGLGGFGETWPCEDIFFLNRLAEAYDCFLLGEQWGWYRFGVNNMWARPDDLLRWDMAKKLFREGAAKHSKRCGIYHKMFGEAMCIFDRDESIRFAARRGSVIRPQSYTWIDEGKTPILLRRLCRLNRNVWHIWISLRAYLFGIHVDRP